MLHTLNMTILFVNYTLKKLRKEYIEMANKRTKRCSKSFAIRENILKTTVWYHCSSIKMVKIQQNKTTWQHLLLVKMWNKRNSHSLLMGMQNGAVTLENSSAVYYKAKYSLPLWLNNHIPRYLSNGFANLCPHKNLHMNVYNSFIHKCPNLEATKILIGGWINKL